jgi:transcriptional regulator with XRE-family HTH domain
MRAAQVLDLPKLACHDVRMDAGEIGRRIRAGRERRHWTQAQLAEAVGIKSLRTIGGWERGEFIPQNRIAALEDVLEIDLGGRVTLDIPMPDVREDLVVTIVVPRRLTPEARRAAEAAARGAAEAVIAMESEQSEQKGSNGQ